MKQSAGPPTIVFDVEGVYGLISDSEEATRYFGGLPWEDLDSNLTAILDVVERYKVDTCLCFVGALLPGLEERLPELSSEDTGGWLDRLAKFRRCTPLSFQSVSGVIPRIRASPSVQTGSHSLLHQILSVKEDSMSWFESQERICRELLQENFGEEPAYFVPPQNRFDKQFRGEDTVFGRYARFRANDLDVYTTTDPEVYFSWKSRAIRLATTVAPFLALGRVREVYLRMDPASYVVQYPLLMLTFALFPNLVRTVWLHPHNLRDRRRLDRFESYCSRFARMQAR